MKKGYKRSESDKQNKSKALKAYWARVRTSKQQYAERTANMGTKSPEKVAEARREWWSDAENRETACANMRNAWSKLTPEERSECIAKGNEQRKISCAISRKAFWDNITDEEYALIISNMSASQTKERKRRNSKGVRRAIREGRFKPWEHAWTWYHTTPNGREILVQSSWEEATADTLEYLGFSFKRGDRINVGEGFWIPDFDLGDFLLEVKGHPLAWERFNKLLPGIKKIGRPVAVLPFKPKVGSYRSKLDLINDLTWMTLSSD